MASEIEAEMARFEEEVLGNDGGMPDLPPPPMFAQESSSKDNSVDDKQLDMNKLYGSGPNIGTTPRYDGPPRNNRFSEDSLPPPGPLPDFDRMRGPGPMMMGHGNMPGMMGLPPGPVVDDRDIGPGMNGMMGPMHGMGHMGNQFMGGPMHMGPVPDIMKPPVISAKAKVYSAEAVIMKPPQIVKRKPEAPVNEIKEKLPKLVRRGEATETAPSVPTPPSYKKILEIQEMPLPMDMGMMIGPKKTTAPLSSSLPPSVMHNKPSSSNPPAPMAFTQASAASAAYSQAGKLTLQGKKKKFLRTAAGTTWEDPTLLDWDPSDYRIFCGDLGNEVTDDMLMRVFNKYSSFQKAKVVREKNTKKSKGYGFVSFKDPNDFIRAMREMNGKYVGNRPIKLRKSNWKDRNMDVVKKKLKEKKRLGYKI